MNQVKICGSPFYENTSFEFNGIGMIISVSINITKSMANVMSKNNVYKSNKRYVYRLSKQLESKDINKQNIESVQDFLLKRCMYWGRQANIELLEKQSNIIKENIENNIKTSQLSLTFN